MNRLIVLAVLVIAIGCGKQPVSDVDNLPLLEDTLNLILNKWHNDAANANTQAYFGRIADDGMFLGTDPSEHWTKQAFSEWSKPYFDSSRTWSFTPIERHWYIKEGNTQVWFDELLETQMGVCRGTGVLSRNTEGWKIDHYALSLTLPNDKLREYIELANQE